MAEEPGFEYDVALSFAGEDRVFVEAVAAALKRRGVRVFYDRYEQADLWGKDLFEHLDEVYRKQARFCLMFLSKHYVSKEFTAHERRSAQARSLAGRSEYILPVRLDDSEVPGFLPTTAYLDGADYPPEAVAELVAEKLRLENRREKGTSADAVGLLVDLDYLQSAAKGLDPAGVGSALVAYAQRFGDLQGRWASGDPGMPDRDLAEGLIGAGFSVTVPTRRGHSGVALLERLITESSRGELRTFVMVTGDAGFLDAVSTVLLNGHVVRLVAHSRSLHPGYRDLAEKREAVRRAAGMADTDFIIDELRAVLSTIEK